MRVKRIRMPTDLSEASMPALKLAVEFGKVFQAELVLLFVVERLDASGDILSAGSVASVVEAQKRAARTRLAREVARLGKRGVRVRSTIGEAVWNSPATR
jgi:nucleotide-binding universal stress UspA family protein